MNKLLKQALEENADGIGSFHVRFFDADWEELSEFTASYQTVDQVSTLLGWWSMLRAVPSFRENATDERIAHIRLMTVEAAHG